MRRNSGRRVLQHGICGYPIEKTATVALTTVELQARRPDRFLDSLGPKPTNSGRSGLTSDRYSAVTIGLSKEPAWMQRNSFERS